MLCDATLLTIHFPVRFEQMKYSFEAKEYTDTIVIIVVLPSNYVGRRALYGILLLQFSSVR